MAVRGGPGRGPGLRAALRCAGMVLAAAGAAIGLAAAAGEPGALAHHATVLNGTLAGSGFAIAGDRVLTNAHVVAGLAPGEMLVLVASEGARAEVLGRLLAVSDRMDLALIAVPAGFLPAVGPEDAPLGAGLALVAAGVDAGGDEMLPRMELAGRLVRAQPRATGFGPGLVARLPGVRPGFSGGPVLDGEGRLVGMIAAIRPAPVLPQAAASLVTVHRPAGDDEALVLPAGAIRAEAERLLAAGR